MKISQLIAELEAIRAQHGDLNVRVFARRNPSSVTEIKRLDVYHASRDLTKPVSVVLTP
ncbi:hypothetical protein B2_4 [Stenotrophomonas phage B2]|nr:hypothetical protein B2_4 [Stenotrophomonas phage B2]